jgi:plastocyanin
MGMASAPERARWIAAAAIAGAIGAVAALGVRAEPATGGVGGSVQLLRRSLLGGPSPAEDASGVVVYVTGFARAAPSEPALLNQKNEQFAPRVLPIVQGQSVTFPNQDRIYHNVFSVSALAPFDLGQYKSSDPPRSVAFEKPGLVPVYCNIHPQMLSYVVVLENDAFAVTGADGRFEIAGVPAGTVEVHAWAPGAQRVSRSVQVGAGARADVQLVLEQTERIAPHKRKDGSDYPKPDYEEE